MTTFIEFADTVLAQRAEDGIRGIKREESRFRVHIVKAGFAPMPMEQIEAKHIADWLREMSQKKPQDQRGDRLLSRATIQRSQALVSVVFAEALQRGMIGANPCVGVKLKRRAGTEATEDGWAFLTLGEQRMIARCEAIPRPARLAIQFAYLTGLRQGEQRHLRIQDVALDASDPHIIVRYASRSPKGELLPPKSGKTRRVPLLPEAQEVTREWIDQLGSFAPHNPHGLMFPTSRGTYRCEGKPLGRSGVLKGYYQTAGIELRPFLHWHALRHTFCSSLVSGAWGRRWTLEEVRPVAGHSSILITQRYAHLAEDVIAKAARETSVACAPNVSAMTITKHVVEEQPTFLGRIAGAFRALRGVA